MVWGPGTFGFGEASLAMWKETECPLMDTTKVKHDGNKVRAA